MRKRRKVVKGRERNVAEIVVGSPLKNRGRKHFKCQGRGEREEVSESRKRRERDIFLPVVQETHDLQKVWAILYGQRGT